MSVAGLERMTTGSVAKHLTQLRHTCRQTLTFSPPPPRPTCGQKNTVNSDKCEEQLNIFNMRLHGVYFEVKVFDLRNVLLNRERLFLATTEGQVCVK